MSNDGFGHIVSIDYSPVVITQMEEINAEGDGQHGIECIYEAEDVPVQDPHDKFTEKSIQNEDIESNHSIDQEQEQQLYHEENIDDIVARHLCYELMDVRAMKYENSTFDILIDKGTLDSILCGDSGSSDAENMLRECSRVLKQNGMFFIVSYGKPYQRLKHLENPKYSWTVVVDMLTATRFLYVLTKL